MLTEKDESDWITVLGCGGIGGYLVLPLLRYCENYRSNTKIRLIDGDKFEKKNIDRQVCSPESIGVNKARWLGSLCGLLKQKQTEIEVFEDYVTKDNIERLLGSSSVIFLCVDNNATRKLVNDWFTENNGYYFRLLINGGNEEKDGNVQMVYSGLMDMCQTHPEINKPQDTNPGEDCIQQAASTPQISVANNMAASLMLMQYYRWEEKATTFMRLEENHELFFDIERGVMSGYDRNPSTDKKGKGLRRPVATPSVRV